MSASTQFAHEELEYRARYVAQEAWSFARAAKRSIITASDVTLAARGAGCAAAPLTAPWSQLPESAAARLILSEGCVRAHAVPPSELIAGGGGAGASGVENRAAAAALASVVAGLQSAAGEGENEGAEGGAALASLGATLRALEPSQARRLLPSVVAELRSVLERVILDDSAHHGGSARALRVLRVVQLLAEDDALPVEACPGEMLALATSAVLTSGGGGGASSSGGGGGGVSSSAADAPADAAMLRVRDFAARVLAAVTLRVSRSWPDATDQVVGVLADALAAATPGGTQAAVTAPAAIIGAAAALKRITPSAQMADTVGQLLVRLLARWADVPPKAGSWGEAAHLEVASAAARLSRSPLMVL
jgi:hypothetical protein